ncbi:MAG: hypothetical protein IPO60_09575 [Flavobacteriales bacterium]|nr:hypothetical protein [Flavobacteriales bacterium]
MKRSSTASDLPDGDLFLTQRAQGVWSTPERMTDRINRGRRTQRDHFPGLLGGHLISDRPGGRRLGPLSHPAPA